MATYLKSQQGSPTLLKVGKGRVVRNWPITDEYERLLARFNNGLAGKSPDTRYLYGWCVRHWLAFLTDRWGGPDEEEFNREHADTWVAFLLEESGYSHATIQSMVQAAKQLCKKLVGDDVLDESPFVHVRDLPQPVLKDIQIITAEEVQRMVDAAKRERNIWAKRDVALMLLLYSGGFRREELLNIQEADIDWVRGTVHIKRGKGGQPRTIAPGAVALTALDRYMSARRKFLAGLRRHRAQMLEDGTIWLSMRGVQFGANGLRGALKLRAEQAGVTTPTHPHAWRHAAATHDADSGMSEMMMRDKYGWSPTSNMPFRYSRQTLRERTLAQSDQNAAGNAIKI